MTYVPDRSGRRAPRAATVAVASWVFAGVLLAGWLTAGCTVHRDGANRDGSTREEKVRPVPTGPRSTLGSLAAELRRIVDGLVALAEFQAGGKLADDPTVCNMGDNSPDPSLTWSYSVQQFVWGTDSRPVGRLVYDRLAADGWELVVDRDDDERFEFRAFRDGYALSVGSVDDNGGFGIHGNSPCVASNGDVTPLGR